MRVPYVSHTVYDIRTYVYIHEAWYIYIYPCCVHCHSAWVAHCPDSQSVFVLSLIPHYTHVQMKFLNRNIVTNNFDWPRTRCNTKCVSRKFIFFGPVTLIGSGPFHVKGIKNITKTYAYIKVLTKNLSRFSD